VPNWDRADIIRSTKGAYYPVLVLLEHIENELEGLTFKLCDINYLPAIENLVKRTMVNRHKERRSGRGCGDDRRANATSPTPSRNPSQTNAFLLLDLMAFGF
jgi:hypothetical protein